LQVTLLVAHGNIHGHFLYRAADVFESDPGGQRPANRAIQRFIAAPTGVRI
jgi:hypothetical protein